MSLYNFFSTSFKNLKSVSSIAPTSRVATQKVVSIIDTHKYKNKEINILEVGAGNGAFTKEIVKKLKKEDNLYIIEILPSFCEILQEQYIGFSNVHVICADALEYDFKGKNFEYIICGLPFVSFSYDLTKALLEKFTKIEKGGGLSCIRYPILPFFKYVWLFLFNQKSLQDYKKNLDFFKKFSGKYLTRKQFEFFNLPPVNILWFKF